MSRRENIAYFIRTFLFCLIVVPFVASFCNVFVLLFFKIFRFEAMSDYVYILLVVLIAGIALIFLCIGYASLHSSPDTVFQRLSPVFLSFFYYAVAWMLNFQAHDYMYGYGKDFFLCTFSFFMYTLVFLMGRTYVWFLILIVLVYGIVGTTIWLTARTQCKVSSPDRRIWICLFLTVLLVAANGLQFYERSYRIITQHSAVQSVPFSYFLPAKYEPFSENNLLPIFSEAPSLSIEGMPPIIGTSAATHLMAACTVQATYNEHIYDPSSLDGTIRSGGTYTWLQEKKIDLLLSLAPTEEEAALFKTEGQILTLTPIAKQALVFMVHKDNPIDNLSLSELQGIFRGDIRNWHMVGGKQSRIRAFGHCSNRDGPRVLMERVLHDSITISPIYKESMPGIYSFADYHNFPNAIGYMFSSYVMGKSACDNIKILSIDSVYPSAENVQNGSYPYTAVIYAATSHHSNPQAQQLVCWLQGLQAQAYLRECGYVPV